MLQHANSRKQTVAELHRMFETIDKDGSGEVSWEEFQSIVSDPRLLYYFRKIGVYFEPENAFGVFELLDFDASGKVDLDEFVMACSHFGGTARVLDLVRVQHELRKLRRDLSQGNFLRLLTES